MPKTWSRTPGSAGRRRPKTEVRSPRAYLTTIVTRLAINRLRSARTKRETYVGPWLPEPLVTEDAPDAVELAESLSMAFLVLLERLSPIERAVFLLHEVFDFEYAEIARMVDKTEANCRQLLARAKKRVGAARTRFEADPDQARRLTERFTEASVAGDLDGLVAAAGGRHHPVGGRRRQGQGRGAQATARRDAGGPIHPRHHAERGSRGDRLPATRINGQPGFIAYLSGRPLSALIFDIHDGRIHTIYAVGNPDKLQTLPAS